MEQKRSVLYIVHFLTDCHEHKAPGNGNHFQIKRILFTVVLKIIRGSGSSALESALPENSLLKIFLRVKIYSVS